MGYIELNPSYPIVRHNVRVDGKREIKELIKKARETRPEVLQDNLPPMPDFPDVRDWHAFENDIWQIGEQIRQIYLNHKSLRKDHELMREIVDFCKDKRAERGRQSFLFSISNIHCKSFSSEIAELLTDEDVYGHALDALLKMRADGFIDEVEPLANSKHTWIKKLARKYLERYSPPDLLSL